MLKFSTIDSKSFKQRFGHRYDGAFVGAYCGGLSYISDHTSGTLYPHTWMLLETQPLEFLLDIFPKHNADWWCEIETIIKYERMSALWHGRIINICKRNRDQFDNIGTDVWDLSIFFKWDGLKMMSTIIKKEEKW